MADQTSQPQVFDLLIVGGGINGCGIARDAAGRGYSVALCERDDLASGTSSASTKLIHGGLRYLERYEFRLVHASLKEREVLWRIAPHIIRPLRFVLPHHRGLRPAWLLRLGLFLYDHLGGRKLLPPTRTLDLRVEAAGQPLKAGPFDKGFEYSDCWVDDARLVVLNAMGAAEEGAVIATRSTLTAAERGGGLWIATVEDTRKGLTRQIHARALINAAGPWAPGILANQLSEGSPSLTRLVKGSHIVVPRLYEHTSSYIFQNDDGRIVFAIPYESDFTLIGTTDLDFTGDPATVKITPDEIAYLCEAASEYFAAPVKPADVVWSYSGVRSLVDDGTQSAQAATRDYVLDLHASESLAPLLTVVGGKITTYRRLAEQALRLLQPYLPGVSRRREGWTAEQALPGGNVAIDALPAIAAELARSYPFLDEQHVQRLTRTYGTRARRILGDARSAEDLGPAFGATLTGAEVAYLKRYEWARTTDDILWRRTKLGLKMTALERAALTAFLSHGDTLAKRIRSVSRTS